MRAPGRLTWAFLILAVGIVAAIFLPAPIVGCLGPLGVTAIQCAQTTGILPRIGPGLVVLGTSALLAAVIGIPDAPAAWPRRVLSAGAGAAIAAAVYLVLRPTSWSDATSTGEVITLELPLDLSALVVACLLGATAGIVLARLAHSRRSTPSRFAAVR